MTEAITATRPGTQTASTCRRRLFTREEYQAMGRARILDEDERVELLGGEIIVMAAGRYREMRRYEPGEVLAPSALPDLRLDVASLIPARTRS